MDWYKRRSPSRAGYVRRHVGIALDPKDWELIENECEESSDSMAFLLTEVIRNYCVRRREHKVSRAVAEQVKENWRQYASRADLTEGQR